MSHFFAMGGYGAFIWPAYGAAALLMAGVLVQSWRAMQQREAQVETLRASRRKERENITESQP